MTTVLGRTNNHIRSTAIFTSPTEGLTIPMKISAIAGLLGALPVTLWQVWGFVAPGLQPVEKRFVGPFVVSAFLLFAGGAAFAYFVTPIGLNFLATFLGSSAVYLPDIKLLPVVPASAHHRFWRHLRAAGGGHPARGAGHRLV